VTCLVPGFPRQARTDQRESADRIDPALAAEATESTDAAEKTEPIDKIEPAEPIDKMDPAEPIDKMDPLEPTDKIDPLEPMLRMDPSLFRMESFSQDQGIKESLNRARYPAAPDFGAAVAAWSASDRTSSATCGYTQTGQVVLS
jgi:hypothetical protein